jgi:hypothetical protein
MGQGGDVFVLDMGQPVKIIDLARRMVELSGDLADGLFGFQEAVNWVSFFAAEVRGCTAFCVNGAEISPWASGLRTEW